MNGNELEDDKQLSYYGIMKAAKFYLEIKRTRETEMGIAVGGKMTQKIYKDDEININFYNIKQVTRIFVNIANGTMWEAITGKELPESPLTPQLYKDYGYPWFDLYDDKLKHVKKSDILANVKSVKQIENEKQKAQKNQNETTQDDDDDDSQMDKDIPIDKKHGIKHPKNDV